MCDLEKVCRSELRKSLGVVAFIVKRFIEKSFTRQKVAIFSALFGDSLVKKNKNKKRAEVKGELKNLHNLAPYTRKLKRIYLYRELSVSRFCTTYN